MRHLRRIALPAVFLQLLLPASGAPPSGSAPYLRSPADKEFARVTPGGTTILPNGRFLTPKGERLYTGENLFNVAVRPDGGLAVGFFEGGLALYPLPAKTGVIPRLLSTKGLFPVGVFTKDGSRLIVSNGDGGGIAVYETKDWSDPVERKGTERFKLLEDKPLKVISGNLPPYDSTYINDLVLSSDEHTVFAVDVAHQRVVVFDLESGTVVASAKAGREPFAIALSEDGRRLAVANIGLFDYSVVPPPEKGHEAEGTPRGLSRPPFGFPTHESEKGVRQEGRNVAGIGTPYVPDAQSVWMYDVSNPKQPKLGQTVKTGMLIHAPADSGKAVGGSAPNKLLIRGDRLFVSNANSDTLQIFNTTTLKLIRTIKLSPSPLVEGLRGTIPSGMTLSADGKRLYVCESGINAVAVIDPESGRVLGHIPTGWFPVQATLAPDGKTLFVATQKGIGRGPRGPKTPRSAEDERAGLTDMPGMIDAIPVPADADLPALSATVNINNGLTNRRVDLATLAPSAAPRLPGQPSKEITHVVFITKENHTFDGIFGGLKGAEGEADYAEFGRNGWLKEKGKDERIPIMPNHWKLAENYAISDNFYMEPQASGDGHRWLVGVYPSIWTNRVFYAGWKFKLSDNAKGRLVSFGSNGSQIPEDYLENGSLWEHLERGGVTFRNYGEGYELPGSDEDAMTNKTGNYFRVNHPMPKVLFDNTCFEFPAYNNNIPDIARADWFKEDMEKYRKGHKGQIPRFLNIAICNDHGAGPNAKRGYPYVGSYMADNDLALGRIVEYLSKQPEWRHMAIFVTQDDSGGDNDHIDRHRSFVLCISPYAKKGYVSRDHTSIMSIIKTIYLLFGLGPNNQFDALATDLSDMLTTKPDFTPYRHVPADPRVFKPSETFDPSDPKFERRRQEDPGVTMDDPKFVEWLRTRGGK